MVARELGWQLNRVLAAQRRRMDQTLRTNLGIEITDARYQQIKGRISEGYAAICGFLAQVLAKLRAFDQARSIIHARLPLESLY